MQRYQGADLGVLRDEKVSDIGQCNMDGSNKNVIGLIDFITNYLDLD